MIKNAKDQLTEKRINNTGLPPYIIKSVAVFDGLPINPIKPQQNNTTPDEFSGLIKGKKLQEPSRLFLQKEISQKQIKKQNPDIPHRKNIYRSRKQKKTILGRPQPVKKTKLSENMGLIYFFRNQICSLFSLLSKRQQYLNILKGKKVELSILPLKPVQVEERLLKQIKNKGKDKGRKNFNQLTNEQLRSLKYKPKPTPVKKDGKNKNQDDIFLQQSQGECEEEDEDYPDMYTWKRKNGVSQYQKVFIIKGGYHELRRTLIDKGWAENEDVWSKFYDLKWTTKMCDINYAEIKNGQMVNHFNNNHHLTSKYGITRRLRSLTMSYNIDIDKFYPRCFDLGDQVDVQNFIESFKFSFAESVARRFLVDKQRYKGLELKVRTILSILEKKSLTLTERINQINNGNFPVITVEQWPIITQTDQFSQTDKQHLLESLYKKEKEESEEATFQLLHQKIETLLEKMYQNDPQSFINGYRNVWIAKPNFLSRGRGIRCFNNLYDIADYCFGRDVQFVIQKYIEKPMLIEGRKFDIRQWVTITDFNPPKIYFYDECYLRFCMDDYSLDNIHNRFIHLTNNQIQKHNKKKSIEESVWEMSRFINEVGEQNWKVIQQKIKNIVVWSIKSCQGYVTPKKGSCQFVGFDFMIDENLNPWIIQINMSPSMEATTNVLKKLTKNVLKDTGLLIANNKPKQKVGGYTCIYQGDEDLQKYQLYCQSSCSSLKK